MPPRHRHGHIAVEKGPGTADVSGAGRVLGQSPLEKHQRQPIRNCHQHGVPERKALKLIICGEKYAIMSNQRQRLWDKDIHGDIQTNSAPLPLLGPGLWSGRAMAFQESKVKTWIKVYILGGASIVECPVSCLLSGIESGCCRLLVLAFKVLWLLVLVRVLWCYLVVHCPMAWARVQSRNFAHVAQLGRCNLAINDIAHIYCILHT